MPKKPTVFNEDFTGIVIPDTHIPYHDYRAFNLVCDVIQSIQPTYLIILGDFADCYSVSSHSKDPRRINSLHEEISYVRENLQYLEACAGKAKKVFIKGNHENRLERYLQDKAPELYDLVQQSDVFGLHAHQWEVVEYRESIKIGNIWFTHDIGLAGIHSTYQSLRMCQHNLIIGHNHRMNYHVQSNTTGTPHVGASFGWLGDVTQIDYMHKLVAMASWTLGFGWIRHDAATNLTIPTPIPILDYHCWVEGQKFSG